MINDRVITSIRALDGSSDAQGGEIVIVQGGVNHTSVHIDIKSKSGYSFNYTLEIYVARCVPLRLTLW